MSDENEKSRAAADLRGWEELKRNKNFTGLFMRRVNEEVAKRRAIVLDDRTLTPDELFKARLLYFAALDTANLAEQDEIACRRTLGNEPG